MHIQQIEKIQIASEQLEDALSAYFAGRFHSALVLASAAEQLYAGYVMKHGETPAWKRSRSVVTKIANGLRREEGDKPTCEDDIGDLLNRAYNSSKHAGKNDHTVFMDPQFEANVAIERAIENYDALERLGISGLPDMPLAQRFLEESISDEKST
jgi:hypothetical protein